MDKALSELIRISRAVGRDPSLVQGGGGNTSVKTADGKYMYIKASGTALKDMGPNAGWRRMRLDAVLSIITDTSLNRLEKQTREVEVVNRLLLACDDQVAGDARPSVEAHLHGLLDTCVIHLHPSTVGAYLNAKTGSLIWQLNIVEKVKSRIPRWALAESLLVDGDNLISCPGGPQTCMVALAKANGSVVWKAPSTREWAGYASPTLFEYKGLRIITTLTSKSMIGVNAHTGELLWRIRHESPYDENIMMPVFHDGFVFISTPLAGSVKWKLNVKDGKISLKRLWRTQQLDNHHGGVILVNENLYGSSTAFNKNLLVCLDFKTGRTKHMDMCVGKASLTYADGMLYALSIDGVMGLVQPEPIGHRLVSCFRIPRGGKGKSWAHPVVCGGRLYIRHGEFLYAYRLR